MSANRYVIDHWKVAKVNIDDHVEFEGHHHYSVHRRLVSASA
jgi:hypothetical protein